MTVAIIVRDCFQWSSALSRHRSGASIAILGRVDTNHANDCWFLACSAAGNYRCFLLRFLLFHLFLFRQLPRPQGCPTRDIDSGRLLERLYPTIIITITFITSILLGIDHSVLLSGLFANACMLCVPLAARWHTGVSGVCCHSLHSHLFAFLPHSPFQPPHSFHFAPPLSRHSSFNSCPIRIRLRFAIFASFF